MERILSASGLRHLSYRLCIVNQPDICNVATSSGGVVTVATGIFEAAGTDAEFAAVIGHEIAHSIAHHTEARESAGILCCAMMLPAAPFILGAFIMAEFLIVAVPITFVGAMALLAQDRGAEAEADRIGMLLMAEAGFDPYAAISFWRKMVQVERGMLRKSGKKEAADYQSSHPHSASRIEKAAQELPKFDGQDATPGKYELFASQSSGEVQKSLGGFFGGKTFAT
ncbi:MAG: hypothetical protein Q9195_007647 [Heterodermia aff. obscurata]